VQRVFLPLLPFAYVATLVAQDQPDSSGQWVLASTAFRGPDLAQFLTVKQTIARTNAFGAPMEPFFKEITIERQFVDHSTTDTYQIGTRGGTTGGLIGRNGQPTTQTHFSIRWDDGRLVIETSSDSETPGQSAQHVERTEIWQLDPTGRLRMRVSSSGSGIEPRSSVLTYRRN